MDKQRVRTIVYSIFSETLMVFLALLIIPIIATEYLFELTSTQNLIFSLLSWIIYALFFAEFLLRVIVEEDREAFIKSNKLYVTISLIIIFSPILETISELFVSVLALRALRIFSVLRISRLTRLIAASSRAKVSWRRINFKTYAIVSMIVVLGFAASFFIPKNLLSGTDQVLLLQFIGVVGVVYAIIAGFMIANVWNKYSALINGLTKSATSLRNVYELVLTLKAPAIVDVMRANLVLYLDSLLESYWSIKKSLESSEDRLAVIFHALNGYNPIDPKSIELFTNIIDELRMASEHQANVKALLASKVPKILWALLILLSISLVASIYIIPYESQFLSTLSITFISIAVALIGLIIYDMNDPFKLGFWAVDPEEYVKLKEYLTKQTDLKIGTST